MSSGIAARRLEGRQALVFGAGSAHQGVTGWSMGKPTSHGLGVGQATAIIYARYGAVVTCVDKNLEAAEKTATSIRQEGGEAYALAYDVTKSDQVKEVIEAHIKRSGRIDILHNNVGIVEVGGPVMPAWRN